MIEADTFLKRVRDWHGHPDAFGFLDHSEAAVLLLAAANLGPSHWALTAPVLPGGNNNDHNHSRGSSNQGPTATDGQTTLSVNGAASSTTTTTTAASANPMEESAPPEAASNAQLALIVRSSCCWREQMLTSDRQACVLRHATALVATGALGVELATPLPTSIPIADESVADGKWDGMDSASSEPHLCTIVAAAHTHACPWRDIVTNTALLLSSTVPGATLDSWVVRHKCAAVSFALLSESSAEDVAAATSGETTAAQPARTRILLPRGRPPSLMKRCADVDYSTYFAEPPAEEALSRTEGNDETSTSRGGEASPGRNDGCSRGEGESCDGAATIAPRLTYVGSTAAAPILNILFPRTAPAKRPRPDDMPSSASNALSDDQLAPLECRVRWHLCLMIRLLGLHITHGGGGRALRTGEAGGQIAIHDKYVRRSPHPEAVPTTITTTAIAAAAEQGRAREEVSSTLDHTAITTTFPLDEGPTSLLATLSRAPGADGAREEPTPAPPLRALLSWDLRCAYCGAAPEVRVEKSIDVATTPADSIEEAAATTEAALGGETATATLLGPRPVGAEQSLAVTTTPTTTSFTYHVSLDAAKTPHSACCPWNQLFLLAALRDPRAAEAGGGAAPDASQASLTLSRDTCFTFEVTPPPDRVCLGGHPTEGDTMAVKCQVVPVRAEEGNDSDVEAALSVKEEAAEGVRELCRDCGRNDEEDPVRNKGCCSEVTQRNPSDNARQLENQFLNEEKDNLVEEVEEDNGGDVQPYEPHVEVKTEDDEEEEIVTADPTAESDPNGADPNLKCKTRFFLSLHVLMSTIERLIVCWRASVDAERRFPDAYLRHPLLSQLLSSSLRPLPTTALPRSLSAATAEEVEMFLQQLREHLREDQHSDSSADTPVLIMPPYSARPREAVADGVLRLAARTLSCAVGCPVPPLRPLTDASASAPTAAITTAGADSNALRALLAEGRCLWGGHSDASRTTSVTPPAWGGATQPDASSTALAAFLSRADEALRMPDASTRVTQTATGTAKPRSTTVLCTLPAAMVAELILAVHEHFLPQLSSLSISDPVAGGGQGDEKQHDTMGMAVQGKHEGALVAPSSPLEICPQRTAFSPSAADSSLADAFLAELRRKAVLAEQAAAATARRAQQAQLAQLQASQERQGREQKQQQQRQQQQRGVLTSAARSRSYPHGMHQNHHHHQQQPHINAVVGHRPLVDLQPHAPFQLSAKAAPFVPAGGRPHTSSSSSGGDGLLDAPLLGGRNARQPMVRVGGSVLGPGPAALPPSQAVLGGGGSIAMRPMQLQKPLQHQQQPQLQRQSYPQQQQHQQRRAGGGGGASGGNRGGGSGGGRSTGGRAGGFGGRR